MIFIDLSLYFFIYAFLGWCAEVSFATLKSGKLVNRGFLNGPLCPIYGFGCLGIVTVLTPLSQNLILLFFGSFIFASVLEFVTGFVLGKIFKQKWWDYSKEPFNIMGYVCLRMSVLWGFACVFVVKLVHPPIAFAVSKIPSPVNLIVAVILYAILIADIIVSVFQLIKHKNNLKKLNALIGEKMNEAQAKMRVSSDKISGGIYRGTVKSVTELNELAAKIKKSRLVKAFPALGEKIGFDDIVKKFDQSGKTPAPVYPVFSGDESAPQIEQAANSENTYDKAREQNDNSAQVLTENSGDSQAEN